MDPMSLAQSITAAIQGVNASIDLVKTGLGAKEAAAVMRVEADLLYRLTDVIGQLAQAKDAQAALQDELREAKAAIRRRKEFAAQRKRYALRQIGPQTYAYCLKPEAAGDEPPHCVCPRCFDDGIRAILQKARDDYRTTWLKCLHCGAEFAVAREEAPTPSVIERRDDWSAF